MQELMSQGLVRDLVAHLGGLLAIVRRHGEDLAIDRVSPCVRPAIHLDVDRVARHATEPKQERLPSADIRTCHAQCGPDVEPEEPSEPNRTRKCLSETNRTLL